MNAHTQEQTRPKEDFDFFDDLPEIPPSDLHQLEGSANEREAPSASRKPSAEPAAEAHRYPGDDPQDEMDALDTLDLGVDDEEPAEQPIAKSGPDWKLIGGGVALAVVLFGGLGVFAYKVVFPEKATGQGMAPMSASDLHNEGSIDGALANFNASQVGNGRQPSGNPVNEPVTNAAAAKGGVAGSQGAVAQDHAPAPAASRPTDLVVTYGADKPASSTFPVSAQPDSEEQIYDQALNSLKDTNVPAAAIKIDTGVVREQARENDMKELRATVDATRGDLNQIRQVVGSLKDQIGTLGAAIGERDNAQKELQQSVNNLTAAVKEQNASQAKQNKDVEEVRNALKGYGAELKELQASDRAAVRERMAARRQAPAPTAHQANSAAIADVAPVPVAPKPAVRPLAVVAPAPAVDSVQPRLQEREVSQPVQPAAVEPARAVGCAAGSRSVSANWRVKGVNETSAYLVRTDGTGLYVRKGTPVSGFGTVTGFDPQTRSVCTTDGTVPR
jgi:hypothetical protein